MEGRKGFRTMLVVLVPGGDLKTDVQAAVPSKAATGASGGSEKAWPIIVRERQGG